jgi:ribosomal protein S12 methylthiotransferase accessory factor
LIATSAAPARKGYRAGTHRLVAPEATLARAMPHMAAFGITRIANVTGLDRIGLPVVMVVRPNARSIAVAQGKGLDLAAAKASGLMEALEIAHAETIEAPLRWASRAELAARGRVLAVERLPLPASSRYPPDRRLLWIEGRDLMAGGPVWVPYECVHADFTLPLPAGSGCFVAGTNGLASGNHRLEAICHGIAEVIERDATSLWHRRGLAARAATRLDLATVDDSACAAVLDRLAASGLAVAVWDTTSDLGIAAFECLIADQAQPDGHHGIGAGCHPSRAVALLRALTEAVQVRMTYITGARDDLPAEQYARAGRARTAAYARLLTAGSGVPRPFRSVPESATATFDDDLAWLLARLRACGIEEVAAVDLTRPGIGLPVVKVVIPGLEGADDHDGYQPGPRAQALQEARP